MIDSILYSVNNDYQSDYRAVSTPMISVGTQIATGTKAVLDILKSANRNAMRGRIRSPLRGLSKVQRKALLTNAGYLVGGTPTNAIYKALGLLDSRKLKKSGRWLKGEFEELNNEINEYIDNYGDDPEAKEFIEDLKQYQIETVPQTDKTSLKHITPEATKETIKQVSSKGEWNKLDEDTGAVGIYQFTEDRWLEITAASPELLLTENGRVSKDPEQQEKAMDWSLNNNTKGLALYDIEVTEANLLGAHKFGFDNFVKIFEANRNDKLSKVLGSDAKDPVFNNFKTVKSIKDYIAREVKNVEDK
jgi:hypothetical protein